MKNIGKNVEGSIDLQTKHDRGVIFLKCQTKDLGVSTVVGAVKLVRLQKGSGCWPKRL